MRHFVAYHNTEKMGRPLNDGDPLGLSTNKSVKHLLQNFVWFVVGVDSTVKPGTRQYSLGSVFRVAEVGDRDDDDFKHFASGSGHFFEPPLPIKDFDWFPALCRATGHFGLGVQEIKDESVIAGLSQLAAQAGYEVAAQ